MATQAFVDENDDIEEEDRWFPEEFDTIDDFHQHVLRLRQEALDADRLNRYAALDDLQFVADFDGMQWDEQVRASRRAQGRPCLVTNVLPQFIGQVVGDMTINKTSIKVRPAEDGDKDVAEIREGLIRYIENQSDAASVYTSAGTNQVTCGIGNFKVCLEQSNNVFNQDIFIRNIPNPLAVIWDPSALERTGKDANFCFIDDLISRREFIKEYPEATISPVGDELPIQDIEGWYSGETVRISEFWQMHEEDAVIALFADGSTRYLDSIPTEQPLKVRKTKRKFAVMWLISGNAVLDGPYRLPIDRVPVFRCMGREVYVSNNRVRYGLVRFIKDQQRLKNYADSQIAEFLSMAPRAQWLADEIAAEGRQDSFRNAHLSGDPLLVFNAGGMIQRVDPPPFPMAFLNWSQQQQQGMKDASGLQDASLGIRSNETSGIAIQSRQQEGDVATVMYHDGRNAAIAECGRVANTLIDYTYDTMRMICVLGEDDATKIVKVNDPNDPESPNLSVGRYDTWVDVGPNYGTKRMQSSQFLTDMMKALPPEYIPAIADLLVKSQDMPDAQLLADRFSAMMPPQIANVDKEPTPEQQQQMAQAQQEAEQQKQVQMMGLQLEMQTKQAQAKKADADAAKAEAEAVNIQQQGQLATAESEAKIRLTMAQANLAEAQAAIAGYNAEVDAINAETGATKATAEASKAQAQAMEAWHKVDHAADKTHIDRANTLNNLSPPVSADRENGAEAADEGL
jgi:hypothetical protein